MLLKCDIENGSANMIKLVAYSGYEGDGKW